MDCILKRCAHGDGRRCRLLESCGAEYALNAAAQPGGYLVRTHDNPTIDALERAGLITVTRHSERTSIATAVQSIKSRKVA